MTNPFDRDLEEARAKRDSQGREQEGWRRRAIEDRQEKMRAQAELREAAQAFIARARELEVEATSMRFRDRLVERKVGWFSSKTEKVWHYEETRGWQVQVDHPGDGYSGSGYVPAVAVTVEGEVHHDSWENPREKQVALTDSAAPEMPFRGGGFPYAVSDSRRAMAEFLVRHGG